MRMLRVISSMNPKLGGPVQGIRNLVPTIDAMGHTTEVVCIDGADDYSGCVDPFPIHRVGEGRGPLHYSSSLKPWLEENVLNYDTVIVHGLWQYHSLCTTRVITKFRKRGVMVPKFFVMPHGMLDPWFQRDKSRKIKAWRNWLYWKLVEQCTIGKADGVLFTCQRELELARETFRPYAPTRELNVGYGVAEPREFSSAMRVAFLEKCPGIKDHPYLLFLSRIHPKKGVDLLIKAYGAFAKGAKNAGKDLPSLVIAGPLEGDYATEMQQLARRLGFFKETSTPSGNGPSIYFPGMLQGDSKWGAFYGCEAFVLPSHQENFGIAVVEALACTKPVLISTEINIYTEMKEAGAALVGSDNQAAFENLLRQWIEVPLPARVRMEQAAIALYRRAFLPNSAAKRLLAAISI